MSKKDRSDNYSEEELIDRSVFDHIKQEVNMKSKTKISSGGGNSKVFLVFIVGIMLFGGLLLSGALTGTGPFSGGTNSGDNIADPSNSGNTGGSSQEITLMCINHANVGTHYHYDISIFINGQVYLVPGNIGVTSECMRPVHTHDATGQVHVELPLDYSGDLPDLGDFFDVWGEPFSENQLLETQGDVVLTVNGNEITDNYRDYAPSNGDDIQISV